MDIQNFIAEFKKTFVYDMLKDYVSDEKLFDHVVEGTEVIWMKEQTRQMWSMWQSAKASVAEGFVLMPKEPSPKIVEAFWNNWLVECPNAQTMYFAYKAMIEAQEQSNV